MYPASSSSSSQGSMGPSGGGLFRYGSAPGSLLTTAVDSVIGPNRDFSPFGSRSQTQNLVGSHYFSPETSSLTSESSCKPNNAATNNTHPKEPTVVGLQRSYGSNEIAVGEFATGSNLKNRGGGGSSSLVRHSSSPAGFLNHLAATAAADNGFSVTRGIGNYNSKGASDNGRGISRLSSQLSFTRQDSLSQISEESENVGDDINTDNDPRKAAHSYASASFGMGSWDDTNAIMFSGPQSKRAKHISSDIVSGLNTIESQFQFSMPQTALEMATMENLLQIPQDSVPCKIRAKRGFATHPRSIAERERRTRISGKLKKLQELVPNMDKQTSYADMLDLAVQHIKGLQSQVQNLNEELDGCTCGCKQTT